MKRWLAPTTLCVMALGLSACQKPEPPKAAASPARVQVTTVKSDLFTDEVEALGTVRALEAINITANVEEKVTSVHFEDGQRVKKDDLLVRLSVEEETAMLGGAEANLAEQEREVERLKGLVNDGAVSQVRLQEYLTQRDIARQKINEIKAQIADRTVKAPFDGILGFRSISQGALIQPGVVIATLDVLEPVRLDFAVPETFLADLQPGMTIDSRSEAFPGQVFRGKVTQIDSRVNPVTRSIIVRAEVPNPDLKLRPGMLLTTSLKRNPAKSLIVPERSIVSLQANHFVFVISPVEGQSGVKRTPVGIGRRIPGYIEIVGGLEEGQKIVTDGLVGLRDGALVTITGDFKEPTKPFSPLVKREGENS